MSPHLPDDELEAYALNRLSPAKDCLTEEHLLACGYCLLRLQAEERTVFLGRKAFRVSEFVHEVNGIPIKLWIEPVREAWTAYVSGGEIESTSIWRSADDAVVATAKVFVERYPDHRCGPNCGMPWGQQSCSSPIAVSVDGRVVPSR